MRPTLDDIREAAERIRPLVHRTPVLTSSALDETAGARLFFKCENLQRGGAFKARGAANAVLSLPPEVAARGVLTHSSGNHGAALALAARFRGVPAYVVMPEGAPAVKRAAVAGYGARITPCAPTQAAREETAARVAEETGATVVHPYDDPAVIAGQGTAALELLEEVPDLDLLLVPVGGGGLAAGCAIAAAGLGGGCRVVAAEPAGADDTRRSFDAGERRTVARPQTVADGLRATVGVVTFPLLRRFLADVVTVEDAATVAAMRLVWERMKIVIEPSAAVPVAALLAGGPAVAGRRVGIVLSGGNVDLEHLPWQGGEEVGDGRG